MAPLSNPKHELAARKLAAGQSAHSVYNEVYKPTNPGGNSGRLTKNDEIRDRTLEIINETIPEQFAADHLKEGIEAQNSKVPALRLYYELKGKVGSKVNITNNTQNNVLNITAENIDGCADALNDLLT